MTRPPRHAWLGQASNFKISENRIGVLICPDDNTIQIGQGNLSYVVNGGFALYHAYPIGWVGSNVDYGPAPDVARRSIWAPAAAGWAGAIGVTKKLGVMFPESTFPQGITTRIPWNVRSSLTNVVDGASNTLLAERKHAHRRERHHVGVFEYPAHQQLGLPAAQLHLVHRPVGVCGVPTSFDCTAGQLAPTGDLDGLGWSLANKTGTFANINGGQNLTVEGEYPFSNSAHPAGCNMGFCDGGVRFISQHDRRDGLLQDHHPGRQQAAALCPAAPAQPRCLLSAVSRFSARGPKNRAGEQRK